MDHPVHGVLVGRPRHRATVERGWGGVGLVSRSGKREGVPLRVGGERVRNPVDDNNYYTRRSFVNACVSMGASGRRVGGEMGGWVGRWVGRRGLAMRGRDRMQNAGEGRGGSWWTK